MSLGHSFIASRLANVLFHGLRKHISEMYEIKHWWYFYWTQVYLGSDQWTWNLHLKHKPHFNSYFRQNDWYVIWDFAKWVGCLRTPESDWEDFISLLLDFLPFFCLHSLSVTSTGVKTENIFTTLHFIRETMSSPIIYLLFIIYEGFLPGLWLNVE